MRRRKISTSCERLKLSPYPFDNVSIFRKKFKDSPPSGICNDELKYLRRIGYAKHLTRSSESYHDRSNIRMLRVKCFAYPIRRKYAYSSEEKFFRELVIRNEKVINIITRLAVRRWFFSTAVWFSGFQNVHNLSFFFQFFFSFCHFLIGKKDGATNHLLDTTWVKILLIASILGWTRNQHISFFNKLKIVLE